MSASYGNAGNFDLANGSSITKTAANASYKTVFGEKCWVGTIGPNSGWVSGQLPNLTNFTVVVRFVLVSGATLGPIFSFAAIGSAVGFGLLYHFNNNWLQFDNFASSTIVTVSGSLAQNVIHTAVVTRLNGVLYVYRKGASSSAATSASITGGGPLRFAEGGFYAGPCGVSLLGVLPYGVTAPKANELIVNPWQIFKPRRIYIPTATASATVPTLSASTYVTGSLTSTGWRPQITAS